VGAAKTVFVTDAQDREVLEYSGNNGVVQRWFPYGVGLDEALNQVNVSTGTRNTLIPDMQGSLIGFLSSTGATARAGFQPFGQNPSLAGTASAFRYNVLANVGTVSASGPDRLRGG